MVDSAAFVMRGREELSPGDSLWIEGRAVVIKRIEDGKYKNGGWVLRMVGAPPVYADHQQKVMATK